MMKKLIQFVKKETVLSIAWLLAVISMFFVPPSMDYVKHIDFKSLGILWSLMVVIAGLTKAGLFEHIGNHLLRKTKVTWQLTALLVLLPFFFSMLITNDVALLTFVPFAISMLQISKKENLLIPVIALQTVAANLGSMMTPVGNPQNLYLYGISGMGIGQFLLLMLPYTLCSLGMILVCMLFLKGKGEPIRLADNNKNNSYNNNGKEKLVVSGSAENKKDGTLETTSNRKRQDKDRRAHQTSGRIGQIPFRGLRERNSALFLLLFMISVASVMVPKVLPYWLVVIIVLITTWFIQKEILVQIDYALLFTFVGFFIFTGNLGQLPVVRDSMEALVVGNETLAGVVSSQFISNVPAALLLSGFTSQIPDLIIGVNLGGLGTLIASMASLISFKLLAHNYNEKKGKYFLVFTGINLVFLLGLLFLYLALVKR